MEVREHFYADDPAIGPPDVKTTLAGVAYFLLGNGFIQAAVQVDPSGEGTPLGLLIMDPERLGPKRAGLTMDPIRGLAPTMITIRARGLEFRPGPGAVRSGWLEAAVPTAFAGWEADGLAVDERFFCPDAATPRLARQVCIENRTDRVMDIDVATGVPDDIASARFRIAGGAAAAVVFEYRLIGPTSKRQVRLRSKAAPVRIASGARESWARASALRFGDPVLDRLCHAAHVQLPAAVAASGRMDGSLWQYNLEWVRDQAFNAAALTLDGRFGIARTILARLLDEFVDAEGRTVDSSRIRPDEECEFDQNGVLLLALEIYTDWTGDRTLIREHWSKIERTAEFPLRPVFRHPASGLLRNRREFWERHAAHGVLDGLELAHQLFVSLGLESAARLARDEGRLDQAARWTREGRRLRRAMLGHPRFALVENGRLIKRRTAEGPVQLDIRAPHDSLLPTDTPLFAPGRHLLNPDTATTLPIAWGCVDPRSPLAANTMSSLETLWNQRWTGGGYGRYHVTSEADSPGPWPFPSVFAARAYHEMGRFAKVRRILDWLDGLPGAQAGSWFEFYGPRPVPPYPQVGIIPWTWSEILFLFIRHMLGVRSEGGRLRLRPRLLPGTPGVDASLRVGGGHLEIALRAAGRGRAPRIGLGSRSRPLSDGGILIDRPVLNETIRIEGTV